LQLKGLLGREINDERPATPLDYLEKIFHVPFHLPPMEERGFKSLIDRLTEPVTTKNPVQSLIGQTGANKSPATNVIERQDVTPPSEIKKAELELGLEQRELDSIMLTAETTTPVVGSVPLQRWEREALQVYHPLIQTPRGATRLLNTYRLVRASVPQSEWATFAGDHRFDGEFRVAMLLLAAAAGYPAVARSWFARLLATPPAELFEKQANDPGWSQFKKVYDATFTTPLSHEVFIKWIDRIERFAF